MAPMEGAEITDIVHRAGDLVAEHYVFADVGARLRDRLPDRAGNGAYGDALLLDLRENRGGDPRTVALVCGYLLDEQAHLVTMHQRDTGETVQSWSPAYVPGPRFGATKPLYVLVGPTTFSGAEELSY